jgi:rubrerythrin
MELGTFGAILGFAMELEEEAARFYDSAARGELERVCVERARGARKHLRRLERARRELVSEMILESITGLDSGDYAASGDLDSETEKKTLLAQARDLEAAAARFYRDAATKMPIREVARLLRRLADEHVRHQQEEL